MKTVLHVPRRLHTMRHAIAAGLHRLPTAHLDLYARAQCIPLAERPLLKLSLTGEQRRVIEEHANGLDPATNQPRRYPLWVVVTVALELAGDTAAGRQAGARQAGARRGGS